MIDLLNDPRFREQAKQFRQHCENEPKVELDYIHRYLSGELHLCSRFSYVNLCIVRDLEKEYK